MSSDPKPDPPPLNSQALLNKARAITELIMAGFTRPSVIEFVTTGDIRKLEDEQ